MSYYKYYLETNALYSIAKVNSKVISNAYTSAFALFEIISGITMENFVKRKSVIEKTLKSKIEIDWQFPQEIIFNSFDYFDDFEFIDKRIDHLEDILSILLESVSFKDFQELTSGNNSRFGYFKKMDQDFGNHFIGAAIMANLLLTEIMKNQSKEEVTILNKTYDVSTIQGLRHFFICETEYNHDTVILALARMVHSFFTRCTEEDEDPSELELIVNSYNGHSSIYVDYFSKYCGIKFVERETPAKNDFCDLSHLFYLKNLHGVSMVSNDKLFRQIGIKYSSIDDILLYL